MEAGCASTLRHGELSGPARWTRWPLVPSILQGVGRSGGGPLGARRTGSGRRRVLGAPEDEGRETGGTGGTARGSGPSEVGDGKLWGRGIRRPGSPGRMSGSRWGVSGARGPLSGPHGRGGPGRARRRCLPLTRTCEKA